MPDMTQFDLAIVEYTDETDDATTPPPSSPSQGRRRSQPRLSTARQKKAPSVQVGLRRRTLDMTVVAQDPSILTPAGRILTAKVPVPAERMEPGPRSHRFNVVQHRSKTRAVLPPTDLTVPLAQPHRPGWAYVDRFEDEDDKTLSTNPDFRAQHVYAVASRTLATFEHVLGRRLSWAFPSHHLTLVTAAEPGLGARYSREKRAILFAYKTLGQGEVAYAALSHDVVAHEVTHAVLDGLRPSYTVPGLPDQAAFHEAFADIVALLSVFSVSSVLKFDLRRHGEAQRNRDGTAKVRQKQGRERTSVAAVTPEALGKALMFGVGEQLGAIMHGDPTAALRRSVALDPNHSWGTDPAYNEPHRRGGVLLAAVMQSLRDIWISRLQGLIADGSLDLDLAAQEGAKAAAHLLAMCIRAIDYTPPVEFEFGDFLDALLLADTVAAPDDSYDYRGTLTKSFAAFGIRQPARTRIYVTLRPDPPLYHGLNFDAFQTDRDEVYRFIWNNAPLLGLDLLRDLVVESVRNAVRIGPDGLVINEVVADYTQNAIWNAAELRELLRSHGLTLPRALRADDAVQVWGGGTLVFDEFGRLRYHQHKAIDEWKRQARRVRYLVNNRLCSAPGRYGFRLDGGGAGWQR